MEDDHRIKVVFNRTFANVGSPNSTDTLSMHMPASIAVTIKPSFSSFSVLREKKSFTVQDYGPNIKQRPIISGTIMWSVVRRFTHFSLVLYTLPSPCLRFYRFLHVSRKDEGYTRMESSDTDIEVFVHLRWHVNYCYCCLSHLKETINDDNFQPTYVF